MLSLLKQYLKWSNILIIFICLEQPIVQNRKYNLNKPIDYDMADEKLWWAIKHINILKAHYLTRIVGFVVTCDYKFVWNYDE